MRINPKAGNRRHSKLLAAMLARLATSITLEKPIMSNSRRNALIRTVAAITGDIAAGVAMASVAVWLIESAALGIFLSFLVWLLATIAALALSQYVVHPACEVLLSDRKLDMAVDALSGLADRLTLFARSALQPA
ncbi:MAG: hypothetical protein HXX19_16580 [Rhodoferax sp.]|nr:hypothetical protein [Rhodoferax sp.]